MKYLGFRTTSQLWGIKYTRDPVDEMVGQAKLQLSSDSKPLPLLKLQVTNTGIHVSPMPQNQNPSCPNGRFAIESISYGVQDIKYTRVFAMIVVQDKKKVAHDANGAPFRCHAFVCDSRETAKKLTMELAKAFEVYSKEVKRDSGNAATGESTKSAGKKKRFAIDLRPTDDIRKEDGTVGSDDPDFSEA